MELFLLELGPRPDARLVIEVLFGHLRDVKSDGDSRNPATHQWTYLWIRERSDTQHRTAIEIDQVQQDPLVLAVRAESAEMVALCALFMHSETGCRVCKNVDGNQTLSESELIAACARLSPQERLAHSKTSIWRQATLQYPYPNLPKSEQEEAVKRLQLPME